MSFTGEGWGHYSVNTVGLKENQPRVLFFFFFFEVQGLPLRALRVLGRHRAAELHTQSLNPAPGSKMLVG